MKSSQPAALIVIIIVLTLSLDAFAFPPKTEKKPQAKGEQKKNVEINSNAPGCADNLLECLPAELQLKIIEESKNAAAFKNVSKGCHHFVHHHKVALATWKQFQSFQDFLKACPAETEAPHCAVTQADIQINTAEELHEFLNHFGTKEMTGIKIRLLKPLDQSTLSPFLNFKNFTQLTTFEIYGPSVETHGTAGRNQELLAKQLGEGLASLPNPQLFRHLVMNDLIGNPAHPNGRPPQTRIEAFGALVSGLQALKKLEKLDLSKNDLSKRSNDSAPGFLDQWQDKKLMLPELREFTAEDAQIFQELDTNLKGKKTKKDLIHYGTALATALQSSPKLRELNLSGNLIPAQELLPLLQSSAITTLYVHGVSLKDLKALSKVTKLKELGIEKRYSETTTKEHAEAIAKILKSNPNLELLELEQNFNKDSFPQDLARAFKEAKPQLRSFRLVTSHAENLERLLDRTPELESIFVNFENHFQTELPKLLELVGKKCPKLKKIVIPQSQFADLDRSRLALPQGRILEIASDETE